MPNSYHLTIKNSEQKLIDLLEVETQLTKAALKDAINKGALWLTRGNRTNRLRRVTTELKVNDELHFYYNKDVLTQAAPPAVLIADEGQFSIWYKPYGMLCQGSKWSDHCTINRFAEKHLSPQRPAFIVHRLDRAASGLVLIAHSKKVAAKLARQFELREIEKTYQIVVQGDHRPFDQPQKIDQPVDGKHATSHFRCLAFNSDLQRSLIEVKIETGRKHQIRQHASFIGLPVIGDRLYGQEDTLNLQLCAVSLSFTDPTNDKSLSYQLPTELNLSLESAQ